MKTHYDNLQVKENASIEVIKGAYKHLSQKWHPDRNPSNFEEAERVTKIINEAYHILSDQEKRKNYDNKLRNQRSQTKQNSSINSSKEALSDNTKKQKSPVEINKKHICLSALILVTVFYAVLGINGDHMLGAIMGAFVGAIISAVLYAILDAFSGKEDSYKPVPPTPKNKNNKVITSNAENWLDTRQFLVCTFLIFLSFIIFQCGIALEIMEDFSTRMLAFHMGSVLTQFIGYSFISMVLLLILNLIFIGIPNRQRIRSLFFISISVIFTIIMALNIQLIFENSVAEIINFFAKKTPITNRIILFFVYVTSSIIYIIGISPIIVVMQELVNTDDALEQSGT